MLICKQTFDRLTDGLTIVNSDNTIDNIPVDDFVQHTYIFGDTEIYKTVSKNGESYSISSKLEDDFNEWMK